MHVEVNISEGAKVKGAHLKYRVWCKTNPHSSPTVRHGGRQQHVVVANLVRVDGKRNGAINRAAKDLSMEWRLTC